MNYSCPPVATASNYSQELSHYDHIFKIVSCSIMSSLTVPVTLINLLVIWTIVKTPSVQTPSFILICSLALTDFGSGLIAFPINASWRIVEFVDPTINVHCSTFDVGFAISFTLLSASELTVTALSVDRYLAIRLSHHYRRQVTNRRAVKVVVFLWCIAVIWGTSSVFITPKVLHATVVVVGVITFGAIFVCYALAFKSLLIQETKSKAMNTQPSNSIVGQSSIIPEEKAPRLIRTPSPSSQNMWDEKQPSPYKRGKFSLQINTKVLPVKENGSPVENQDEIKCFSEWPSSDLAENTKRKVSEAVEIEFKEGFYGFRAGCGNNYGHNSDERCIFSTMKDTKEPNLLDGENKPQKKTLCPLSIELCVSSCENNAAFKNLNKQSRTSPFKHPVEENAFKKTKNQDSRKEKNCLKVKTLGIFKSRAGTSVRLLKYRHTIVTLLWVIAMLILCYAPYFLLSIVVVFIGMTDEIAVTWSIIITLLCVNSLINPLIYLWRLKGLRRACVSTLKTACCKPLGG